MQRMAAAAMMPSGVPPVPISRSVPDSGRAAAIAPATSPSEISLIRAPVSRTRAFSSAWRGRSSMHTVRSDTDDFFALATLRRFSDTGAVMSIASAASGPTAIFSM